MANHWDIPKLISQLGTRIKGYHLHNTDGVHDLHRPMFEEGLWYTPEEMERLLRQIGREFNVKINEAMLDFPAASATDN